jgi:hypothetical protein
VVHDDAAGDMAKVIQVLDRLVNETSGIGTPPEAWKRLRELRAEAFLAFETMTGKSAGEGSQAPQRRTPELRMLRADAMMAFWELTGKSVGEAVEGRK